MERRDPLQLEITRLETKLDAGRVTGELATVRRGLADTGTREPAVALPSLRIGFACKQRWDDMVGDERVRACAGCDRPVFNLSEMTRAEAERVLATRGLTPCVRFYRRPDGTVMTTDCPSGVPRDRRRLAVVASSLAAGTVLATAAPARADPDPTPETTVETPDAISDAAAGEPDPVKPVVTTILIDDRMEMGLPESRTFDAEMGVIIAIPEDRPKLEWSLWGRLAAGIGSSSGPGLISRTRPGRISPAPGSISSTTEAALGAELTVGVARSGDLRLGAWTELRTTSDPVAGGELVIEGLPPHPWDSRIGGEGSIVLRAGGNAHVVTGALGFGYVGSHGDPWPRWARHVVGARVVASLNRSLDDPRDWSATLGLEIDPIGAIHAVLDFVK